jgi:hypothetical protein
LLSAMLKMLSALLFGAGLTADRFYLQKEI